MSTAIAFLSGKGGSGKTTLALSMADLLSRCEIRTLLIDCDLSTNGASYFYETRLPGFENKANRFLCSISETIKYGINKKQNPTNLTEELVFVPIKINPHLDFFPSISEVTDRNALVDYLFPYNNSIIQRLLAWAQGSYDVILYDCQAGYSPLLPLILPMMDEDIFVLEADSISGSALRSLHLKIGNDFGRAKLYQIFNKATPEEYDIYSKIVGTFFVNIGTILFDWKIRQAFSRSIIPDIENSSTKYGVDLCEICKIIFPDLNMQEKLSFFSKKLTYSQLEEERGKLSSKMSELKKESKNRVISTISISLSLFALFVMTAILLSSQVLSIINISEKYIMAFVVAIIVLIVTLVSNNYIRSDDKRELFKTYEEQLKIIDKKLNNQ